MTLSPARLSRAQVRACEIGARVLPVIFIIVTFFSGVLRSSVDWGGEGMPHSCTGATNHTVRAQQLDVGLTHAVAATRRAACLSHSQGTAVSWPEDHFRFAQTSPTQLNASAAVLCCAGQPIPWHGRNPSVALAPIV